MRTVTKIVSASATALVIAALGTAIASTQLAHADEAPDPLVAQLHQRFDKLGIDPTTQEVLLAKYLRGETLDADGGAVEPVSETERTESGRLVIRYVYPDGSVAEASSKAKPGGAGMQLIEGCKHTVHQDQHTYTGCKVSWDATTWSGGFVANYGYYQFGSHVDGVNGAWFEGLGDISGITTSIPVATCNSSCTSWGQAAAIQKVTISKVGVTRTIGVKISVNNSNMKGGKSSSFG